MRRPIDRNGPRCRSVSRDRLLGHRTGPAESQNRNQEGKGHQHPDRCGGVVATHGGLLGSGNGPSPFSLPGEVAISVYSARYVAVMAATEHFHDHLRARADGAVGHLTLTRPDKLNPLSTGVLLGIRDAARWFDTRRDLKVVVVAGEGRSFSAGADVAAFVGAHDDGLTPRDRADSGRRMADALEAMSAVTVARIQGHCIGGGVVLASACDLRVAGESASFAIPEVDLGIPLAWGGIPRLIREIGAPATRDLVMTCRRFDATEALRLGLLQRMVPDAELDAEVDSLVAELLDKASLPLRSTKQHINAVTAEMLGMERSWADADGLAAALHDDESRAAAQRYLQRLGDAEGRGGR